MKPCFNWDVCVLVHSHLAHLALTVSGQEGHVVDLVHHHEVLLLPLEVLEERNTRTKCRKNNKNRKPETSMDTRKLT